MQHQTIMIIDDDQDDRDFFFEALMEVDNECGFLAASNGIDAIKSLNHAGTPPPDMIFLALNMPLMNRFQCQEKIRNISAFKHTPVIIYTTPYAVENKESYKELNPVYFLSKPTRYNEIVRTLTFLLKNKNWENDEYWKEKVINLDE